MPLARPRHSFPRIAAVTVTAPRFRVSEFPRFRVSDITDFCGFLRISVDPLFLASDHIPEDCVRDLHHTALAPKTFGVPLVLC